MFLVFTLGLILEYFVKVILSRMYDISGVGLIAAFWQALFTLEKNSTNQYCNVLFDTLSGLLIVVMNNSQTS